MISFEPIIPANIEKFKIFQALYDAVRDTASEGNRFIAEYPEPQILNKTHYIRTGKLKQSWSSLTRANANRIEGLVGSNSYIAPYNRDVQGPESERDPMFPQRGGWRGVPELKAMMNIELTKRIEWNLKRVLK
jgi:hypothetical protein